MVSETHRSAAAAGPLPWRRLLGTAGGVVLGLVLLVAAWAKLLDPLGFASLIESEGLDFLLPAPAVAYLALGLEVALGLALVLGLRRLWVLVPSALLVAFFVFLNARTYWLDAQGLRQEAASCGCFGNLVERTPAEALWQDALLLVPALLLAFVGRRAAAGVPRLRLAAVAVVTAAALALAWKAPELPLDDLATRLRPGVELGELCAGRGDERVCFATVVPELAQGSHRVILADLGDEEFGAAVPRLNDDVLSDQQPPLTVVSSATPQEHATFFWTRGPAFEIREAPPALLAGLYRRLPRSFEVRDGRVIRTYSGLPPLGPAAETGAAGDGAASERAGR